MPKQTPSQRDFLLSFFPRPHDSFRLTQVNRFILNRYISGETGEPYVAVYSMKSWEDSSQNKDHPIYLPKIQDEQTVP